MSSDKFDLQKVHDCFEKSLKDDDDILMDFYLEGFKELYKFFQLMGTVFGFVSSDVKSKVEILEEFRKKENAEKFIAVKVMIDYEKASNLLDKNGYVSGSRTLLRLHRGLDFIREFLQQVSTLEADDKTAHVCQAAYNSTLSQYHPWVIRKGAQMAMYALPTREQLMKKVCNEPDKAIIILPEMLDVMKIVYDRTQQLYTINDLHGLP